MVSPGGGYWNAVVAPAYDEALGGLRLSAARAAYVAGMRMRRQSWPKGTMFWWTSIVWLATI